MRRVSALIVVLFAVAIAACGGSTEGLSGSALYGQSCAGCHGDSGQGGIGPALGPGSDTELTLTDSDVADVIRVGPGAMPSFSRLTPEQVDSLVDFIRSLASDTAASGD